MLQFWCIVQNIRRLNLEHPKGLVSRVGHSFEESPVLSSSNCGLVFQLSFLNSLIMVFGGSDTWQSDGNA
jgi:hypothetical protein